MRLMPELSTQQSNTNIFFLLLSLLTFVPLSGNAASAASAAPVATTHRKVVVAKAEAEPLKFSHACDGGDSLVISAVGDFLFHSNLQEQAARSPDRFVSLWQDALPLFAKADLRYGNLEGPVAPGFRVGGVPSADPGLKFDNSVYTSYPEFNYPSAVAEDLASSGLTIVSTANNHALDRSSPGVDATISNLARVGVKSVGTRASSDKPKWFEVTETKGFSLAWVACTFSTNGLPDHLKQVLGCFNDTPELLRLVTQLSHTAGIDAVIVTPHWGEEYRLQPIASQIELGQKLMDAGALAVIGTHPHVLEPWRKYVSADGKEHFLIYSTGNFVSGQFGVQQTSSVLLYLVFGRNATEQTFIRGVGYVPLRMETHTARGLSIRPLTLIADQAPAEAWSTWYGDYGRANRIFATDGDLANKFCQMP
jgi:hypothetical protein